MIVDYTNNASGDIDISSGDFTLANPYDTTEGHKCDILMASQGDFKASPLTGVGIVDYINGENNGLMLRDISLQMQRDGIKVERIEIDNDGQILIDGQYESKSRK